MTPAIGQSRSRRRTASTGTAPQLRPRPSIGRAASMRNMSQRAAVITLIGVVVASVASVAFAAWTVTGSGSGSVKAASVTALNASAAPTSPLFPGSTAGITVTVTNKNPFAVEVQSFTAGKGVTVDDGHAGDCDGSNVVV